MPIPANRKKHLQSLGLPNDVDTIRRTRHFVLGAGLTLGEMADLASINPNSLRVYLSGCYDRHQGAESNTYGPSTAATPSSSTTCYDNGGSSGATQQYSVEISNGSNVNCALSFRFQ